MIFWKFYPSIDLHGEYTTTAYTVIHEFLKEQQKLGKEYVVIIHGKGTGKLKEEVHHILSQESIVLEYHLDPDNLGQTLVHINTNVN